jgi:hypothetical protein
LAPALHYFARPVNPGSFSRSCLFYFIDFCPTFYTTNAYLTFRTNNVSVILKSKVIISMQKEEKKNKRTFEEPTRGLKKAF